jgi:hypothetical protein
MHPFFLTPPWRGRDAKDMVLRALVLLRFTFLFLSAPFHKFAPVFSDEFACREPGLPVSVCRHPAGAQFEFLDTLSPGLTPVASGVSPPAGA